MNKISIFFKSKDAKWYVERSFVLLIIIAFTVIFVFADISWNDIWQSSHGAIGMFWIIFYRTLLNKYFENKYLGKKPNNWAFLFFVAILLIIPWFMHLFMVGLVLFSAILLFWNDWRKWRSELKRYNV
jgi:hypothetical protein